MRPLLTYLSLLLAGVGGCGRVAVLPPLPAAPPRDEAVVLLHGLARTAHSMSGQAAHLRGLGYRVLNLDYPSRRHPVQALSAATLPAAVRQLQQSGAVKIHFVTHSMGAIVLRHYLARSVPPQLGRIVMLAPPNQGSELVDRFGHWPGFYLINGPAGQQLGTGPHSLPSQLGPLRHGDVGVIAGDRSVNPLLSWWLPRPNDGKVSVARARLAGMRDFLVVPHSHSFIMQCPDVLAQTAHFLRHGEFYRAPLR